MVSDSLSHGHHGTVYQVTYAQYTTLAVNLVLRSVPHYRLAWVVWPSVTYVVAVVVLSLTVRRLGGVRPAVTAGAVAVAAAPSVLFPYVAQGYHDLTAVNCIVLACLLVGFAGARRPARLVGCALAVGIVTGMNVASDHLLLAIGVAPFVVATIVLVVWWRDRAAATLAARSGVTMGVAGLFWWLTRLVANRMHIVDAGQPVHLVHWAQVGHQVRLVGAVMMNWWACRSSTS